MLEIGKGNASTSHTRNLYTHAVLVDIVAKYFLHGSDSRKIVYHHSLEGNTRNRKRIRTRRNYSRKETTLKGVKVSGEKQKRK